MAVKKLRIREYHKDKEHDILHPETDSTQVTDFNSAVTSIVESKTKTYSQMTAAQLNTGTSTTGMVVSPKVVSDYVKSTASSAAESAALSKADADSVYTKSDVYNKSEVDTALAAVDGTPKWISHSGYQLDKQTSAQTSSDMDKMGCIAIGCGASAKGKHGSAERNIAIGDSAEAGTQGLNDNIAIGAAAKAGAQNAGQYENIAIGGKAIASGNAGNIAIGTNSEVSGTSVAQSVALGDSSVANEAKVVSMGSSSLKRRIINVDDGVNDTDVITLGQAKTLINQVVQTAMRMANPEFIKGTQTAATGAWTGVTKEAELYDGKYILYYLPYAGSGDATLTLTLSNGKKTDAIPIYRYGTTAVTTTYPATEIIPLIYYEDKNAWFSVDYNTNTTYSAGTAALLTAGTNASNRVWSAKILADYVKAQISSNNDKILPKYSVEFTPTTNQTLHATLKYPVEFSGTSNFTADLVSSVPTVTAYSVPDSGYTAGTVSVTRNDKVFTVSATDATERGGLYINFGFEIAEYGNVYNDDEFPDEFFGLILKDGYQNENNWFQIGNVYTDSAWEDSLYPVVEQIASPMPTIGYASTTQEYIDAGQALYSQSGGWSEQTYNKQFKLQDDGSFQFRFRMPAIDSFYIKKRFTSGTYQGNVYVETIAIYGGMRSQINLDYLGQVRMESNTAAGSVVSLIYNRSEWKSLVMDEGTVRTILNNTSQSNPLVILFRIYVDEASTS